MMSSPVMAWVVLGFVVMASLALLAASIRFLFQNGRRSLALDRRLQTVRKHALSANGGLDVRMEDGTMRAVSIPMLSVIGATAFRVAATLVPIDASERVKIGVLMVKAGFQHRDALAFFLSLKLILMLVVGVAAGFLAWRMELLGGHPLFTGVAALTGLVIGGLLPEAGLRRLLARRKLNLSRALPDALDLMVLCVEAGYTFERSLAMVARELQPLAPDLARELSSVEAELRVGAERKRVLQEFYDRTETEGIRDFAMTIIQAERFGTPIGQAIQNIARNERTQRAARIEAQAGRLPVIMSLPMLLFVVPGILILLGGPAFMNAFKALDGLG